MPKKKHDGLISRHTPADLNRNMPATLDKKNRSVEVVMATETVSKVFDPVRWEVTDEILLMSGVQIPPGRDIPLTVEHERHAGAVIGSVRDIRVEGRQLVGRAEFSEATDAAPYFTKVVEGHLNRFSVVYPSESRRSTWIDDGAEKVIEGKTYQGPIMITQSWQPKSLGLVLYAADKNAKSRDSEQDLTNRSGGATKKMSESEIKRVQKGERQRIAEIAAMFSAHGLSRAASNRLIESGASVESAKDVVLDFLKNRMEDQGGDGFRRARSFGDDQNIRPYGDAARITADGVDKKAAAMTDGMVMRSGIDLDEKERAPGASDFRNASIVSIARHCLGNTRHVMQLSKNRVIQEALSERAVNTADLPYVLANVANKVLQKAYIASPGTFKAWTRETNVADFKTISRPQISGAGDLDQLLELQPYKYGDLTEAQETYQAYRYGKMFALSRESLVNDDLGALTQLPKAMAASAKRHVNSAVYAVLVANAAMGDGTALFHADHSNVGTAGAPSTTTLSEGRKLMRLQTGLNGALINVGPKFLIVPAALETTADELLNSYASLADNKNEGVVNPFYRKLDIVCDAALDSDSAVKWYLAADPNLLDGIEISYVGNKKEPYLESKQGWTVDGIEYKVRLEYGLKALDHRGLFYNAGA